MAPPISKVHDYSEFFQAFESLLSYLIFLMKKAKKELVSFEYEEFSNKTYAICEDYRKSNLNFEDHSRNRRILPVLKEIHSG